MSTVQSISPVNSDGLQVHLRIHTGEKPYSCPQCGKRFSHLSTVQFHLRSHTGEKPYPCPQCDKLFSRLSTPARHLRIHTGSKHYVCQSCDKQFSDCTNLRVHQRIHTDRGQGGQDAFRQDFRNNGLSNQQQLLDYVCSSLIPTREIDDVEEPTYLGDDNLPNFHEGHYGLAPVTLASFSAAAAVDFLSASRPCLHPNIAMVYGVTQITDSCATLVMKNVITSLSHLLDNTAALLSLRERLDIAVGCVSAVDYLHHQLGVSHGMLTCDYIFCSSSLATKVLDPAIAVLIAGRPARLCNGIQDDILQLGHVLLALFRGVVFDVESDLCDESGQCCETHRLHAVLRRMINCKKSDVPSSVEVLSVLEGIRKTDQYRRCPPKHYLDC